MTASPRIRRSRALLPLLVTAAAALASEAAAAACANASTLFRGYEPNAAIAYSDLCVDRNFTVEVGALQYKSLNLSNLNLVSVVSYPTVNRMLISDNFLTTFQTAEADSTMEELDLHANVITDVQTLVLPRRLTKLNLADNNISTLGSDVPWPAGKELTWLALDKNHFDVINADALRQLTSLTYLSISASRIENLGDLSFPSTLSVLNLSSNPITSEKLNFTSPPLALKTLDMSRNNLTKFPDLSAFISLVDLNLAGNSIASITGVRLPPKLTTLNLSGNAVETIEIAESDFTIFEQLQLVITTSALSGTCKSSKAVLKTVGTGVTVCVLSDELFASGSSGDNSSKSSASSDKGTGTLNDPDASKSSSSSSSSHLSSKSMLLLGLGCFGMGILVAAFVFLVRRDGRFIARKDPRSATFAPEVSAGSGRTFGRSGEADQDEYSNASWVFGSPAKDFSGSIGPHNVVAILEDDRNRRGRGRSKVEDLLVYEIPLDEILIKEQMTENHQRAEAMYMADYQGYQVVMHALLHGRSKLQRGRRRFEREFVEQVRLASLLEHVCIVQFIGVTFGSHSQSQKSSQLKWKMGVVFEHMQNGSLLALFQEERIRREGKQLCRTLSSSSLKSTRSDGWAAFSWYPVTQVSATDSGSPVQYTHRCKLSVALDVAMALVYLHTMGYVHGDLRAEKVLVNEQGEAKLSGMDIDLALNLTGYTSAPLDVRASAVKAHMKVKHIFQTSISQSPALDSSLLNSRAAGNGGVAPMAKTSLTTSSIITSASTRARRRGMQGDVYAFGLLLWELDTMMCVNAMKRLTAVATEIGEEHMMLRFSPECPSEIQYLARRCWHPDLKERPTALDLQEEIVRMLEGRLTTLSERSVTGHRWSRRMSSSINGSSSVHSSNSSHSLSDYRASSLVLAETEV